MYLKRVVKRIAFSARLLLTCELPGWKLGGQAVSRAYILRASISSAVSCCPLDLHSSTACQHTRTLKFWGSL